MIEFIALAGIAAQHLRIVEHVDPINDSKSVYAIVGEADRHLAVGCDNVTNQSSIRVVVHFNRYIGDAIPGIISGGTQMQYRFDQRPAETVFWFSRGKEVMAEAGRTLPMKFISSMRSSSRVYIRAFDYNANPVDLTFNYENAQDMVEDMFVRCGFSPDGIAPVADKARKHNSQR
jgi:hypothetical protein